jgi:hypothetical protein
MNLGPNFMCKDKEYKYEEEIWAIVEILESEGFIKHLPT